MTSHIMSESGLGMAWTSRLYIPGNSSIPNNYEKCLAAILVQTCSSRKLCSCTLFGRHHDPSHDFGYPSFVMSANGQNPLRNLTRTESMKVQFGWWVSNFSKVSMSILQMILNRSGQSNIITCLTGLFSAIGLGHGNGFAVSEYPAFGPNSSSSIFHRYFLAPFSLLPLVWYHWWASTLSSTHLCHFTMLHTFMPYEYMTPYDPPCKLEVL